MTGGRPIEDSSTLIAPSTRSPSGARHAAEVSMIRTMLNPSEPTRSWPSHTETKKPRQRRDRLDDPNHSDEEPKPTIPFSASDAGIATQSTNERFRGFLVRPCAAGHGWWSVGLVYRWAGSDPVRLRARTDWRPVVETEVELLSRFRLRATSGHGSAHDFAERDWVAPYLRASWLTDRGGRCP